MPARFCPSCRAPNELSADFCKFCGAPLALGSPVSTATPEGSENASLASDPEAPRARPRRRSPIGVLLLVLGVALLIVLAFALPQVRTILTPGGNSGGPAPSTHVTTLVRQSNRTLDPGPSNASVTRFTVPAGSTGATVRGNFSIGGCLPTVNLCLASTAVVTATNWSKFLAGGPLSVLWCYAGALVQCPAEAHLSFTTTSLDAFDGQALVFVVWSVGVLPETGCAWDAELQYTSP